MSLYQLSCVYNNMKVIKIPWRLSATTCIEEQRQERMKQVLEH